MSVMMNEEFPNAPRPPRKNYTGKVQGADGVLYIFSKGKVTGTENPIDTWIQSALTIPELRDIYNQVRDPATGKFIYNADGIANMITASEWYRTNGPTVSQNLLNKAKFGDTWYQNQLKNTSLVVNSLANGLGLPLDNDLFARKVKAFTESAFLNGWDANMIEQMMLADPVLGKYSQNLYAERVNKISQEANLLGLVLDDKTKESFRQRLIGVIDANGNRIQTSEDMLRAELRRQSASLYPVFSEQIMNGASLWDLTSSYRSKAADLLELDADSISWDDPLFKDGKIFTRVNEKTGQLEVRPTWESEMLIKQDERWQTTNNAYKAYDDGSKFILERFGYIGK